MPDVASDNSLDVNTFGPSLPFSPTLPGFPSGPLGNEIKMIKTANKKLSHCIYS